MMIYLIYNSSEKYYQKNPNAQIKKPNGDGREKMYMEPEITGTSGFLNKNRPALISRALFRKARLSASAYMYR